MGRFIYYGVVIAILLLAVVFAQNARTGKKSAFEKGAHISEQDQPPKDTCCAAPPHQQLAPQWIGKGRKKRRIFRV